MLIPNFNALQKITVNNYNTYNHTATPSIDANLVQDLLQKFSNLENRFNAPSLVSANDPIFSQIPEMSFSSNPHYGIAANEVGRVWGDPHFEDPDGGKFDFQGQAGKDYNLLNDTGLAFNAHFISWGEGKTVMGNTGIALTGPRGTSKVEFSKNGAWINGIPLAPGAMETLADGGVAHFSEDRKTLTLKTNEGYTITQKCNEGYINADVKTPRVGVAADKRLPGGLLGQTFDADKLARQGLGQQGEGAIAGVGSDYEIEGGLFGEINPRIQRGLSNSFLGTVGQIFQQAGLQAPEILPSLNPFSQTPIDWNKMMVDQSLDFLVQQNSRQSLMQNIQTNDQKNKKLEALLLKLLQTGNIDMAMLVLAQLESQAAQEMVGNLTKQIQQAQQKRRDLSQQIAGLSGKENQQSQLQQLQLGISEVADTLQMIQTMIKDVADQKNRTMEFANNYLNSENQTTMSIVRGMRG